MTYPTPNKPTYLQVSAAHRMPEYRVDGEVWECRRDAYAQASGPDGGWYVMAERFGCSKTYKTPEAAVRGMLYEHGCTDVTVAPAEQVRASS